MINYKKEIIKSIEGLSGKYHKWRIFDDFISIMALTIRNSVNIVDWKKKEDEYFKIIEKYTVKEMDVFADMFAKLVMAFEREKTDILGEIFMELDIANKWQGQFFTPMDISDLMAGMTIGDNLEEIIKQKGYITVNEPAVGGGAMVISVAKALEKKGYNYQKQMVVIAQDLDIKAVQMAYIQLSLLGIAANVVHMNTLSMKIFEEWKTPFYILGNWEYKLRKQESKKKQFFNFEEDETGQLKIS